MTRSTSIEAYHDVEESGMLSRARAEIHQIIKRFGPLTSAEAFLILNKNKSDLLKTLNQSRARFTELRDQDAIYERPKRACTTNGRKAIEWADTGRPPKPASKIKKEKCIRCNGTGHEPEHDWGF